MAEGVLVDIAVSILTELGSLAVQEIALACGVKDEIHKLKDTSSTIEGVLLDAEEQYNNKNKEVRVWLRRLKDAFYDADDLLDDFSTELLRREVMTGSKMAKAVRIFFSKSNQIAYSLKMANKIKTVRKKLDGIANDRAKFHLTERHNANRVANSERETHSFVRAEKVIGRDDDRNEIIGRLLDSNVDENVSVISIVGLGGIGKTTLTQLVYNDEKIVNYFQLRMWVSVADDFNVKIIVEKIIKSATYKEPEKLEVDQLQECLRKEIDGKKYLLVLDDVWNESPIRWDELKNLLMNGARGSKILVTTRSEQIAKITSKLPSYVYVLRKLADDKSWSLFTQIAFRNGVEPKDSKLVAIGKEIVAKCAGIPLVIRTIGHILYNNNAKDDWLNFRDNEMSKIIQNESDILPILKLSYDCLSSHLKQCFAYCALFPKDYRIKKQKLIYLWMAQGFLQSSNKNQCLEDVGNMYFMNLLSRSFFQDPEYDERDNVVTCKMHVLMHDLALLVAGTECVMATLDTKRIDERCRHVSFDCGVLNPSWKFPSILLRAQHIRTLILFVDYYVDYGSDDCYEILLSYRYLRVLDLDYLELKKLPSSIGKLKHLRYLNLSNNYYIEKLPDSILRLKNLETLDLSYCNELKELPRDFRKLVNLKHLIIEGCNSLIGMPYGLGQLTNLQTLQLFVAHKRNWWACKKNKYGALDELKGLNNLRGKLTVKNLGHMENSRLANLDGKQYLQFLTLEWEESDNGEVGIHEAVLEGLKPHPNLKEISIYSFMGVKISNWLSSLTNLTSIRIDYCRRCRHVPMLDQLPSLKSLYLEVLDALEYISDKALSMEFFPSLEELTIRHCPKLQGWWRRDDDDDGAPTQFTKWPSFPCLSKLCIQHCLKLTSMPLYPSLETLSLWNTSSKPLQQTMMLMHGVEPSTSYNIFAPLFKLKSLFICEIEDLEYIPEEWLRNLTSLVEMKIVSCPRLSQLSQGIGYLTSLQNMSIEWCDELDLPNNKDDGDMQWQSLRSLSSLTFCGLPKLLSLPEGLQYVTTLQYLNLHNCPNLTALPEWINNLTSLLWLRIFSCPNLSERYQKNMGMDWSKIAHIPIIIIDYKWIQWEGFYKLNS